MYHRLAGKHHSNSTCHEVPAGTAWVRLTIHTQLHTVRCVHELSDLLHHAMHTHTLPRKEKKPENEIRKFLLYNGYTEIPGFMGQIH